MKKFCKDLKQHATKIINYKIKNEMIPLNYEEMNFTKSKKFAKKNLY